MQRALIMYYMMYMFAHTPGAARLARGPRSFASLDRTYNGNLNAVWTVDCVVLNPFVDCSAAHATLLPVLAPVSGVSVFKCISFHLHHAHVQYMATCITCHAR